MYKLPPLNGLRTFAVAGRQLSFSKAASELGVTPAAVSHQVKGLEAFLGTQLFVRQGREVRLTATGKQLLPGICDGFDRLIEAIDETLAQEDSGVLNASVTPSFAAKWLVPRLERFYRLRPDIDVRISASMELANIPNDGFDIGVRFGFGKYPGLRVDKIFDEAAVPMCSPRLFDGPHPLRTPEDLRHHVLLHDDSLLKIGDTLPDWQMWLKAAGYGHIESGRGLHFSYSDHAIDAAIAGTGVALSRVSLVTSDVESGRLVLPFALDLPLVPAYYIVASKSLAESSHIKAFREWVLTEAEEEREGRARVLSGAHSLSQSETASDGL